MRASLLAAISLAGALMPGRALAQAAPATVPSGDVCITLADGATRTGRFVRLDAHEVVIRQGKSWELRFTLAEVSRVETVPHHTRNVALTGLAAGFVIGLAGDWCHTGQPYGSPTEPACLSAMPALMTAAGGALGATIGHAIDTRRRQILYVATSQARIKLAGFPLRRGAGAVVTFEW